MGFRVLDISFSSSKRSEIQRNLTSPNRWGRWELYATFSVDFWNGLAAAASTDDAAGRGCWHATDQQRFYISNLPGE